MEMEEDERMLLLRKRGLMAAGAAEALERRV